MGAVLQFEVDRSRFREKSSFVPDRYDGETPDGRLLALGFTAVKDTLRNGGTFVLVVSNDTITMVQHDDAKSINEPTP